MSTERLLPTTFCSYKHYGGLNSALSAVPGWAEIAETQTSARGTASLTAAVPPAEIQMLVLAGRMGEAIELTQRLYPGLLEKQQSLLFMLRVRQFIEMVNGTDSEVSVRGRGGWGGGGGGGGGSG